MTDPADSPPSTPRSPRWPWLLLALGVLWTILIRIPLILNAADHLDSDLAVDGLTLLDATHGHWRWHYPGTPYMGIPPVLLSWPQAMIWGADPSTLVSGGTLIWVGVVLAVFELARRVFGLETAAWALVPLVFSSLGTIWLSGRITGGHLLTLAWHALAFVGFAATCRRRDLTPWLLLGLWCGLGVYLDTMFAFTLVGLGSAGGLLWLLEGRPRPDLRLVGALLGGCVIGFLPGIIGRDVDPYDAYPDQFQPLWNTEVVANHAAILGLECLPRLITGSEVSTLQKDLAPYGRTLLDELLGALLHPGRGRALVLADVAMLALGGILFALSVIWLIFDPGAARDPLRKSVRVGLLVSSLTILAAFLVNRNIFNSDNYRYLGFLVVPWSLGFGMFARSLVEHSRRGLYASLAIAACFAILMTTTTWSWYRSKRNYLEGVATPTTVESRAWTRQRVGGREPGLGASVVTIPDGVTHLLGDYWDVYRIAFLSGGKVTGVPFPMYPNRLQGWSKGLAPGQGSLMILTPFQGWKDALATLWKREGRDPQELDRLTYVLPR